jgi:methionyl aminopeptidase
MGIKYKTLEEIQTLREGGRIHAQILKEVGKKVKAGVKTSDLDAYTASLLDAAGATAAFLGYTPKGISYPYPASICISVNEEIVHGIPSPDKVLQEGDIVTLDLGVNYNGMITDAAVTFPVGKIDDKSKLLLKANREALDAAIAAIKIGGHVGDVGAAVMRVAEKYGLSIPEDLAGHGVGYSVHEEPFVPNEAEAGEGPEFKEGMVLAIEPMFTLGSPVIKVLKDEYTYVTRDGSRSCQFEHTVAVTRGGVEILTK